MSNLFAYLQLLVLAFFVGGLAHSQDKRTESYQTQVVRIQSDGYGEKLGTVFFRFLVVR